MLTTAGATALSAGLGFMGNLFGSGMSAEYNAAEAQKNREFQERMYHQQVEDNIKFWNMQNEYNLPSAQLQRLQNAGLNPLLMYGEGGISGNLAQQAPQSAQAPHGAQAQTQFNTQIDLANLKLVEAQAKLLESQANKTDKESDNIGEQTTGLQFMNWLNDQTRNVQVALRFRDYDRVNQLIAESRERVFNMQQYRMQDFRQLQFQNDLAIKRFNLDSYQVGQNILQGWENVTSNRISANASMKNAVAALRNAATAASLAPWQIGVMRENIKNMSLDNEFLRKTMNYRTFGQKNIADQEFWKRQIYMWREIAEEAGIDNVKADTFAKKMQAELYNSQSNYMDMQTILAPVNAFTSFGATGYGQQVLMPTQTTRKIGFQ